MHTKLPWGYWPDCCRDGGMITTNENGGHIAAPTFFEKSPELTKANAAFIVKACNSHYELLDACKEAFGVITEPGVMDVDEWKAWQKKTIFQLKFIIAKAEGK